MADRHDAAPPSPGGAAAVPRVDAEGRALLLELTGLSRSFGAVAALDDVDLTLRTGEILALLGENGAGKTTLSSILAGHYSPDAGSAVLDGAPLALGSARDAVDAGIRMVHQHFALADAHTVLENLMVGQGRLSGLGLPVDDARQRLDAIRRDYDMFVEPDRVVGELTVGERQRLEIIRALYTDARVLLLDEPTAVLTPQEVDGLFAFLRAFRARGNAAIFISHKLEEVLAISDRVQVLRRGRSVGVVETRGTTKQELATLMVGHSIPSYSRPPSQHGDVGARVLDITVTEKGRPPSLEGVSLEFRNGEVLGIAGVAGNGQEVLADVLFGLRAPDEGVIEVGGTSMPAVRSSDAPGLGIARIPDDRLRTGLKLSRPVWENLLAYEYNLYSRWGLLRMRAIRRRCSELIERYDVRGADWDGETASLSGGNLQKLLLARELELQPRVLVACQPTRGLDVGAIHSVYERVEACRSSGAAVVVMSEDLDELLLLSDRIAVFYEGRVQAVVPAEQADRRELGLLMGGHREPAELAV